VEQVLEVAAAALEAGGVDVREVVGDDVDAELLGFHSGRGGVQGTEHRGLLFLPGGGASPMPQGMAASSGGLAPAGAGFAGEAETLAWIGRRSTVQRRRVGSAAASTSSPRRAVSRSARKALGSCTSA